MHVVHFVKHSIVIFACICLFFTGTSAHAASLSSVSVQDRIESLMKQVLVLQKELATLRSKSRTTSNAEFSYKTKFYTGKYESLYIVDGTMLGAQKSKQVGVGDQLLWNTFVTIAGKSFVKDNISEFRIYNDSHSEVSAFVEEKPDHTWILGFNRENEKLVDIYSDDSITQLLLHEYAHIVFFNAERPQDDFIDTFWGTLTKTKYDEARFVTEYAATNPIEDSVESFVKFVKEEKPTQTGKKYDKIRFFYSYPALVTLRSQIRATEFF